MRLVQESISDYTSFLRNEIIDPRNRGTTVQENLGTAGTLFDLTNSDNVKNVSNVSVGGIDQNLRKDYVVHYNPGGSTDQVELRDDANGGTVSATYHYGKTWIYPDFPRISDVTMPRISVTRIGPAQTDYAVGGSEKMYDFTFQTDIWVDRDDVVDIDGESYRGSKLRDYLVDEIYKAVRDQNSWLPYQIYMSIDSASTTQEEITESGKTIRNIYRGRMDVTYHFWWSKNLNDWWS